MLLDNQATSNAFGKEVDKDRKMDNHENLDFLRDTHGKYPYDIELLSNTALTKRLKKLAGNRYNFLKTTFSLLRPTKRIATTLPTL